MQFEKAVNDLGYEKEMCDILGLSFWVTWRRYVITLRLSVRICKHVFLSVVTICTFFLVWSFPVNTIVGKQNVHASCYYGTCTSSSNVEER